MAEKLAILSAFGLRPPINYHLIEIKFQGHNLFVNYCAVPGNGDVLLFYRSSEEHFDGNGSLISREDQKKDRLRTFP